MAQCPSCQTSLPDDFGLIDCPNCGLGLFVEFDGNVRRRDEVEAQALESPVGLVAPEGFELNLPQDLAPVLEPLSDENSVIENSKGGGTAATMASPFDTVDSVNEIPLRAAPPMAIPEAQPMSPGLDDLVEYGNSHASAAGDGVLHYDLMISGIDTADLRKLIQEALTDPLFLWDVEALMKSAHSGELKLMQVPSVKAALVVQRLANLPIKISWVQHALLEP